MPQGTSAPGAARFSRTRLSLAILLAATFSPAIAQENTSTTESAGQTPLEEVSVTGSRIKRDGFDTSTPTSVVSGEDINLSGINELGEYLITIPGITAGISNRESQLSTQNAGLSSVQLRNLGDNRTLVLIDGRRTVSNSANGNRVSLSTIPDAFVERVEVITGAASSVYGSDAIAGVVNIITESDFEGARIDLKSGETVEGGGQENSLELTFGSHFRDGRGYFLVSASADRENPLRFTDRDFALIEADYDYDDGVNEMDTVDGDQPMSAITPGDWADLSAYIPGGQFDTVWYDNNGEHTEDFVTNRDGYNDELPRYLLVPADREQIAAKLNYQLTDRWSAFSQLQYSSIDTLSVRAPNGFDENDTYHIADPVTGIQREAEVGEIPGSNPLIPDSAGPGNLDWSRRFVEVGNQTNDNSRETLRLWGGLEGTVLTDWDAEVSIGYGRFEQNQVRRNELNLTNLTYGLDAEIGPDGEIRCADADARANGCVPVNLFGVGAISGEAANYIRADLTLDAVVQQTNLQAFIAGDLLQLPAGPLGLAAGFEYRRDQMDVVTDELSQLGGVTAATIPSYDGSYDVSEVFVEANIPLLTNVPGAAYLGLETSLRAADYSIDTVGQVGSYSFGAMWRPVEDLLVRTKFGVAQRAPDLTELFSPPRGDFNNISDICDGVTADTTGTVADNCRLDPGIAAAIAAEGEFEQEENSIASPNAGNLNLHEETGRSFTAGISYTPGYLEGFALSVDYYEIEIEDAIGSFSNGDILDQCYSDDATFGNNRFCGLITRDGDGQLSQVIQTSQNLDELFAHGIDTQLRYQFSSSALPGRFQLDITHSHVAKLEQRATGLDGEVVVDHRKGELASDSPDNRARAALTWSGDNWRLGWSSEYIGSMLDSHDRDEEYREELADNPEAEVPLALYLDSVITHHLSASYTHTVSDTELRYYGGVRNIFDETGPFLPGVGEISSGLAGNYNGQYDMAGRYAYLGLTATF